MECYYNYSSEDVMITKVKIFVYIYEILVISVGSSISSGTEGNVFSALILIVLFVP